MIALGTQRATPHQKLYIRTLFDKLELPLDRTTLLHRRAFLGAGLPEPAPGQVVDAVLDALTRDQANQLIRMLKSETENGAR